MANGQCGDDFYVADELYRLARRPGTRAQFTRTVCLMLAAMQAKPKRGQPAGHPQPKEPRK